MYLFISYVLTRDSLKKASRISNETLVSLNTPARIQTRFKPWRPEQSPAGQQLCQHDRSKYRQSGPHLERLVRCVRHAELMFRVLLAPVRFGSARIKYALAVFRYHKWMCG